MNIYEEAKNNIKDIEQRLDELDNRVALESIDNLKIFIEHQELKEERAKKVEELLEDYKYLLSIIDLSDLPQVKKIKLKEKELE